VTGTVILDDQSLAQGHILFEDEQTGPDSGTILGGQFRFSAKVGCKRVRILATELSTTAENSFGQPVRLASFRPVTTSKLS
jgi:hypothetical protein